MEINPNAIASEKIGKLTIHIPVTADDGPSDSINPKILDLRNDPHLCEVSGTWIRDTHDNAPGVLVGSHSLSPSMGGDVIPKFVDVKVNCPKLAAKPTGFPHSGKGKS